MNIQSDTGIRWTRVWGRRGATHNPITGCLHACEWEMPDGQVAECYAKTIADRFSQAHYPQGYAHVTFHPDRLANPRKHKQGMGIFVGSMTDIFQTSVQDNWIQQILDECRATPQHVYLFLTKNAPRLLQFDFPPNAWIGVSSCPDIMFGKRVSHGAKENYMYRAFKVLKQLEVPIRWMSFEPLSDDFSLQLAKYRDKDVINWAVVGAASNGTTIYPPHQEHYDNLMAELDRQSIPVFFKGNMKHLPGAVADWRGNFPDEDWYHASFDWQHEWKTVQKGLF